MDNKEKNSLIDGFVAATKQMLGKEVREKPLWNTHVSGDAIYHFARGIGDDNPLYLDPDYGPNSPIGRQLAPPAFLTSVLYPIIHGASISVPLWFLVGEVMYQWFLPIGIGDYLRATNKPIDLYDTAGSFEDRKIFVLSETCYLNQDDLIVGKCNSTTVCIPETNGRLLVERPIYAYSEEELEKIGALLEKETRNGSRRLHDHELKVGCGLPTFIRAPLTIGDMMCWQAAIGPAFHTGAPGFRELSKSPRTSGKHPVTGWPVSSSQQHEDFLLSTQRGMPYPFDHGVMRLACLTPMVTNWMGDNGFLNSFSMKFAAPILYGDATWYHGIISERSDFDESIFLKIKIVGKNQLGETTTEAEAGLTLPREGVLSVYRQNKFRGKNIEKKAPASFKTAIDLFADAVARQPEANALVFGETRLTYKEVDCQSNRLALGLHSLGVEAKKTVALLMDRSHLLIIAILGILKAGAAFVPMDSGTPQKRLLEMCADCRPDVVIVDETGAGAIKGYSGKTVALDSLLVDIHGSDQSLCDRKTTQDDPAYIMYTSGSIGKAKGVVVTQGNLLSYLLELKPTLGIDADDIYLHSASFAFSAAIRQIFLPLYSGASLVIADNEQRWDPIAIAVLIRKENVTHWDTVPSFLSLCCDTLAKLDPVKIAELLNNGLKRIFLTGEPLMREVPLLWNQTLKHPAQIVNLYSQTETSGTVCLYEIPKNVTAVSGVVPIGFPTPGTAVYILDENLRPVSYGEVGEICVAGPRVSMGYLNLAQLTANRFLTNPFRSGSDSRFFMTGDLGFYSPDGAIVTKGRRDRRVKIRGFRIELEEVEKVLRTHPGVKQSAAVVSDGNGSLPQLLAYFVPEQETVPAKAELRTFVQARLPDYMLPAHFIQLEELPLNSNGKVNYGALPPPDGTRPQLASVFVSPRTNVEKVLTEIWTAILGIDNPGVHDSFFELGGNSLSATRMLFKLRDLFQMEIPLRSIFEAPTVAGLALSITQSLFERQISDGSLNIIKELDDMSDEEAQRLLEKESGLLDFSIG